ncbi:Retrovirus-related Pol polyprotein like [Argiope bruennichi]|uniref:Retrovirus-related Pol polyprotein like n=1 Tax=Argiope bruennichi TaxID=94029 RepID=A0A8T0EMY7_ARGBR|nr:Retrovirus-related Pol polyprotein like [Argiope bruennichi]
MKQGKGVERKLLPLIWHTTYGKEAWNILKDNFEPVSEARLVVLIDDFFELRCNLEQEQIGIFCKYVSEKKNQVKEADFELLDLLVALQLIRRLPAEYDHLVQILYRMKGADFTHLEVERQLINESGSTQLKQKDLNTTENAYNVGSSPRKGISKKPFERSGNVLALQEVLTNTRKTQPEGFVVKGWENHVCRLHTSIYGLHQSGRQWNIELNRILIKLGFQQNELCNGLYTKIDYILLVYVDDIVVYSKSLRVLENLISDLKSKLEITELGQLNTFWV